MKKQYFMFILIGLMSITVINTQAKTLNINGFDGINKDYEAQYNKAMKLVLADDYKEALPILQALKNTNPENTNIDFHIGICKYYLMFDKSVALESFEKASKSIAEDYKNTAGQTKAPLESIYFEALSNQCIGNYEKAKSLYELYIEKSKTNSADKKYVKDAKRKIYLCENPNLVYSSEDNQIITENRTKITKNKQDFVFKNKLSKALEIMNNDYIEGLIAFKELAKDYPNDPNVNYFLGICLLNYKPLHSTSIDYFQNAEKNIIAPQSVTGLACPTLNQYYMAVAYQMDGNHEQAILHFENVEKVYPTKFTAFKPDFQEKLDYSRKFIKTKPDTSNIAILDTAHLNTITNQNNSHLALNSKKNQIDFKVKKDLHVVFPEIKPRIRESIDRIEYSYNGYYYTVQIGAGKMREEYFKNAPDYRIYKYKVAGFDRYFVGKYTTHAEAVEKLRELQKAGYTKAFITKFKGHVN